MASLLQRLEHVRKLLTKDSHVLTPDEDMVINLGVRAIRVGGSLDYDGIRAAVDDIQRVAVLPLFSPSDMSGDRIVRLMKVVNECLLKREYRRLGFIAPAAPVLPMQ
jgi:hypothetical protein